MKPTPEQLKDPKWWDENAHEKATHVMRRKSTGEYEFAFFSDGDYDCDPHRNVSFVVDDSDESAWVAVAERPTHSVDATEKVAGQKFDQGKPMMSLIPPRAEMAVAEVLTFGANKYGPDNWRHVDDLERRYTDAALRHINAYRQRHAHDQESGLPHLAHAICCLMFMLEKDLEQ